MLSSVLQKPPSSSMAMLSRCSSTVQTLARPRVAAAFSSAIVHGFEPSADSRARSRPAAWSTYHCRGFSGKGTDEGQTPPTETTTASPSSSSTAPPPSSSSSSTSPPSSSSSSAAPSEQTVKKDGEGKTQTDSKADGKESGEGKTAEKNEKKSEKDSKQDKETKEDGGKDKKPEGNDSNVNYVLMGALAAAGLSYGWSQLEGPDEITVQELLRDHIVKGDIEKLQIVNRSLCRAYLREGTTTSQSNSQRYLQIQLGSVDAFESKMEQIEEAMGIEPADRIPIQYVSEINWGGILAAYGPTILITMSLILGIRGFMNGNPMGGIPGKGGFGGPLGGGSQGGGRNLFNMNKAFADGKGTVKPDVRFKDVAGQEQAKREVMEFVDFLKDPEKYNKLGARIPKGGLLVGPPGTGKTLLAKATAGEADCPFFALSGSDFVEMYGGVGAARVRDLFKTAREKAPSIIFIDEIDAIGRKRSSGASRGNEEREGTLNQMLVEMDGFQPSTGVVVLAGTNRSDILDSALLRPGRFDRQIQVDKPDLGEREAIFMVHLKPVKLAENLAMEAVAKRMATLTPGFAGADIANVCNESAITAARRGSTSVEMEDFERATERVMAGLPKATNLMGLEQRKTVALHESGHAVAGWFLEHSDPLLKVSIMPRSSGALGFAQYLPQEMSLHSREAILDRMAMTLAGRAAEELFVGKISTGASDDLDKVTKMAYSMVSVYGMNDNVGLLSYNNQGGDQQFYKPYSEATGKLMDREARQLVDQEYMRAKDLLTAKKDIVQALAEALLAKETLVYSDLLSILGDRPHAVPEVYQAYLAKSGNPFTAPLDAENVAAGVAAKGAPDIASASPSQ
mmetsp:Transcript_45521/g.97586  ORF Transcript_45521/g.97586 Transcript_45521/m.97586 type:complete len:852 (-) Transcript_45521:241-2796(-)